MANSNLTIEQENELRAIRDKVTAPAAPSTDGVLAIAAQMRARHVDPTDPVFGKRPDLVAESEMQIKATLLRAGVKEAPVTAATLALKQWETRWSATELSPNAQAMIDQRIAALTAQGPQAVTDAAEALKAQLGDAEYDALCADAGPVAPAAKADLTVLKVLAVQGRYKAARNASRPS